MPRQYGITSNTYKKFIVDSGAAYLNYGEAGQTVLGATRGGSTFTIETEYRDMPVDGAKGAVKGGRRITMVNATLTVNLLELSATFMAKALPGSTVADYPATIGKTHDKITRGLAIALTDYATNVALVGEVTGNDTNPAVFLVKNALADGNFEIAMTDGEEPVLAITFKAHFDPSSMDTEPWEIRFPTIA
jgi:hypothetical protein